MVPVGCVASAIAAWGESVGVAGNMPAFKPGASNSAAEQAVQMGMHPGETPSERSDPAEPTKYSNWPDYQAGGRPRSATLVVRRRDGGVIGT